MFYTPSPSYNSGVLACPYITHHLLDTGVLACHLLGKYQCFRSPMFYPPPPWYGVLTYPCFTHHLVLVSHTISLIPVFLFDTPSPWYRCPCPCFTHHLLDTSVLAGPCLHVSHTIFLISVLLALVLHMVSLLPSTQTECSFHLRKKTKEAADNH